ncbi:hypothetical protein [Aromatoleum petrolei]|uniref:Uncharacterized protein n=1 Tax=Aromatoleum petrolei TaxID=76116 RepID=A0ABX1MMS3_9RHOO|nr:hypothetical protein [Aromatoleum petrolei]NMF89073.1 hypothetical protein [Aromatoleum petrolei]QTQ38335.1 Uncharacterized protein ToN1_42330 [Aromatoleum petrolei]
MEWEFTAEQVVKGDVDYGLEQFRRDLGEEVRLNVASADELQQLCAYNLIYDMCYALATDRKLDEFLATYAYDPPSCQLLREVEPLMSGNVVMLGAILQRMIMDGVEAGMSLERAIDEAAARHQAAVAVAA